MTQMFFILLLYAYVARRLIYMESPIRGRDAISIGETVTKLELDQLNPLELLPFHALTGCDTSARCFIVGKK